MKIAIVLRLAGMAYRTIIRGLLIGWLADPDVEWDDHVIDTLDEFFGYEEE